MRYFYIAFVSAICFMFFASAPPASRAATVPASAPLETGSYRFVPSADGSSYDSAPQCPSEGYPRYEEISSCLENCDECVMDDDRCWSCKNVVIEKEQGWWEKLTDWVYRTLWPKNAAEQRQAPPQPQEAAQQGWFGRAWNVIANVFRKKDVAPAVETETGLSESVDASEETDPAGETLKTAGTSIASYGQGEAAGEETRIDGELSAAIAAADSVSDLFALQSLILYYCSEQHPGDNAAEQACRDRFMEELRKRGDAIKEELIADIDPEDASSETYKKMETLRAVLMAGTSASGEGEMFSIENVNKVMGELNEKANEWFRRRLLEIGLEDLAEWYALASAHTSATSGDGVGLMAGGYPMAAFQYRARRLALRQMAAIDVCNPSPADLKALQDALSASPGCETLLGNAKACADIAAGNLEAAYKSLHDQDQGDSENELAANQTPEPVDCTKRAAATTDAGASGEAAAPDNGGASESVSGEGGVEGGQPSSGGGASGGEPDEESAPAEIPAETEPAVPAVEEEPVVTPAEPEPVVEPEPEPVIEPEPEPVTEPEPEYQCFIWTYDNPTTGWNFTVSECDKTYSDAFGKFPGCGHPPPLVEVTDEPGLCYETGAGFINTDIIIPCRYEAPPSQGILDCVSLQLRTE